MEFKKYQVLGAFFKSYLNGVKLNNEWVEVWEKNINELIETLPHGSGVDGETKFNYEESKNDKLIINSAYHFMDDNGFYDGWTDIQIILKPDWSRVDLNVKGIFPKKYSDIRNYLEELFMESFEENYTKLF